jgi:hypothetical protein
VHQMMSAATANHGGKRGTHQSDMPLPSSGLCKVARAAVYLCMSTAWVVRQVKLGELRALDLSLGKGPRRILRFESPDLEAFAAERGRYPSGRIRPKRVRHLRLVPAANGEGRDR